MFPPPYNQCVGFVAHIVELVLVGMRIMCRDGRSWATVPAGIMMKTTVTTTAAAAAIIVIITIIMIIVTIGNITTIGGAIIITTIGIINVLRTRS
jgi:hypothetical protein